jgi:hypothetical protein
MAKLATRNNMEIEGCSLTIEVRSQRGQLGTSRFSVLVATKKNTRVETGNAKKMNVPQMK